MKKIRKIRILDLCHAYLSLSLPVHEYFQQIAKLAKGLLYTTHTTSIITRSSAIAEIARVGGHYAVQDHSRSPISEALKALIS